MLDKQGYTHAHTDKYVTLEHSPGFLNSTAINTETFSEKLDLSAGMAMYERMYAYIRIYVLYRIFKTGVRNVTCF
jgi:hypothetical protein